MNQLLVEQVQLCLSHLVPEITKVFAVKIVQSKLSINHHGTRFDGSYSTHLAVGGEIGTTRGLFPDRQRDLLEDKNIISNSIHFNCCSQVSNYVYGKCKRVSFFANVITQMMSHPLLNMGRQPAIPHCSNCEAIQNRM